MSALLDVMRYGARAGLRNLALALLIAAGTMTGPLAGIAKAQTTLVALGDSLTHGYGLAPADAFPAQLERWLRAQGRDVTVVNAGVSGDTTAGGLARFDWSVGPEADALIVELGGNDMLRALDPAETRRNLAAIMEKARARGLPVLLAGLTAPMNYGAGYKRDFEAIFTDLSAEHDAILDANFLEGLDPATDAQADGLHPTAQGVAKIVARIGPKTLELLGRIE